VNKLWIIGGVVLALILLSVVGFFAMIYPKMGPKSEPASVVAPPVKPIAPKPTTKIPTLPQPTKISQIKLTVDTPTDRSVVSAMIINVSGSTVPLADVTINELALKADAAGKFTTRLTLVEGDNPVVVTAVDANGNYSEQELTVTYQSPI